MERTDIQHSHAVVAHMHNAGRSEVLRREYSPQEILGLLGHFEFAVGMRLHFLIFAALRGVPFTALPYASKVTGFLQDLNEETPPLENLEV
jgi:polysaccharide pyruvyl transferase WcaK-like protein